MSKLSKQTRERIEADASQWSENQYGHDDINKDYLEGALHEAGRAQGLASTLELINIWIKECKGHGKLLDAEKAMQAIDTALAKYKEVENG
jgi:hypothetical protein